jgi:hypothetical protein
MTSLIIADQSTYFSVFSLCLGIKEATPWARVSSNSDSVSAKLAVREQLPTGPDGEILIAVRAWGVKGAA